MTGTGTGLDPRAVGAWRSARDVRRVAVAIFLALTTTGRLIAWS